MPMPLTTIASMSTTNDPSTTTSNNNNSEDDEVRAWEASGEMNQVVGSQSLLSQEISYAGMSQDEESPSLHFQPFQSPAKTAQQTGLLLSQEVVEDIIPDTSTESPDVANSSEQQLLPPEAESQATDTSKIMASQGNSTLGPLLDAIQLQEQMEVGSATSQWNSLAGIDKNEELPPVPPKSTVLKGSFERSKPKKMPVFEENNLAMRSADLAAKVLENPALAKSLLLRMALERKPPSRLMMPPKLERGGTIPENFVWAHFPVLESILKDCMADYYDLSLRHCQSQEQQNFNNRLVILIQDEAKRQGWEWHSKFSHKILRDRVRCYYKTHIQNAKKRLKTMLRNPTKRANAKHLRHHWDLLQVTVDCEGGSRTENEENIKESVEFNI